MVKVKLNGGVAFPLENTLFLHFIITTKDLIWFLCFQKPESVSYTQKMLNGTIGGIDCKRKSNLE